MANIVQPVISTAYNERQAPLPVAGVSASATAHPNAAPDRIARQSSPLPMLLAGAALAAQLVPGVVEAEGATGAATALGIAVRAATASPAAKTIIAFGAGAAGSYARSLLHDAAAGQLVFKAVTDIGHALDASVRTTFGIPPSGAR